MGILRTKPNLFVGKQNYILAIGVDKYEDRYFTELKSCKRDINNLIDILTNEYQCFKKKDSKKIFDKEATKENIINEIKSIVRKDKASEWNLVIYFAGHGDFVKGSKNEGEGFWIPYNAKYGKKNTYISFEEITSHISSSGVHHILIISDSCYAGSIFRIYRDEKPYIPKCYNIKSRWGLTSGRKERVADGTNRNPSPFSEILVKVLKINSRINKDLTIKRLQVEIENKFEEEYPNENQMPESYPLEIFGYQHNGGQFVFMPKHDKEIPLEISDNKEIIVETKIETPASLILENSKENFVENLSIQVVDEFSSYANDKINNNDSVSLIPNNFKEKKQIIAGIIFFLLIITLIFNIYSNVESNAQPKIENPSSDSIDPTNPNYLNDSTIIVESTYELLNIDTSTKPEVTQVTPPLTNTPRIRVKKVRVFSEVDFSKTDTIGSNIVFVGSFENKENALNIVKRLRVIGYKEAEIVMKENLPFAIVVSGFYTYKSSAKAEVKALKSRGINAYFAEKDMSQIYRNK